MKSRLSASVPGSPKAREDKQVVISRESSVASSRSSSPNGSLSPSVQTSTTLAPRRAGRSERAMDKGKKAPKKRSARRASTVAVSHHAHAARAAVDFTQPDEDEQIPADERLESQEYGDPRNEEFGAEEHEPLSVEGSEQMQSFLKMDYRTKRLEERVKEASQQLASARFELLGENASPLDLDRLKVFANDDRARSLAQDSVKELREKWQGMLERRRASQPMPVEDVRCRAEEDAFQETLRMLMAEVEDAAE
ncbi:unnamed protein product [Effrenium voratum]|nr:unnamed protein product [Effrenium voratum]